MCDERATAATRAEANLQIIPIWKAVAPRHDPLTRLGGFKRAVLLFSEAITFVRVQKRNIALLRIGGYLDGTRVLQMEEQFHELDHA